jgi:hypothetical protein
MEKRHIETPITTAHFVETRTRSARHEQAQFVREGIVDARAWFASVLRRLALLGG